MSNYDITLKFDLSKKICDDEMIGTLEYNKGEYEFKLRDDYETEIIRPSDYDKYPYTISNYKKLVVVLESPHIDEFKCELGNRPANGETGKRFRNNFDLIINNKYSSSLQPDNYIIYLVNSIQYQCSLGFKPDSFRDYVWLELWKNKDIRDDFVGRIDSIDPDIIINCCTKGGHKRDFDGKYISEDDNDKSILKVSVKFIEKLGYDVCKPIVNDGNKNCVLKYQSANEITLKNFVKYQIENECKFIKKPNNYFELLHPINWI
ncbi:hypothetical protein ACQQ2T_07865 [Paraclostridium tenue]